MFITWTSFARILSSPWWQQSPNMTPVWRGRAGPVAALLFYLGEIYPRPPPGGGRGPRAMQGFLLHRRSTAATPPPPQHGHPRSTVAPAARSPLQHGRPRSTAAPQHCRPAARPPRSTATPAAALPTARDGDPGEGEIPRKPVAEAAAPTVGAPRSRLPRHSFYQCCMFFVMFKAIQFRTIVAGVTI
jgi:hypothetical protein